MLGAVPDCADFVPVRGTKERAPRWELVVAVDEPDAVAARARGLGHGMPDGQDPVVEQRPTGPDGLTFRIRAAAS